jgi:hypothetical protein
MICPRWRKRPRIQIVFPGIVKKELPVIGGFLKRVEIVRDKVIEEVSLHLASKNVYFRSKNVQ